MMRFGELKKISDEVNLAKFHATYDEQDAYGRVSPAFRWADGTATIVEPPPIGVNVVAVRQVLEAARALAELNDATHRIMRDGRLSQRGKSEDLDPIRQRAIENIAVMYASALAFGESIDKRETERYAPPPYKSNSVHSLDLEFRQDREVRDVIRAMSADERHALAKRISDSDLKERILLAILRDPSESLTWLHDVAAVVWRKYVDQSDLEGRAHLDIDAASYEWARRALMVIGGVALPAARYERTELALLVSDTGGHAVYGLGTGEVVAAVRSYQAKTAA